MLPDFPIIKEKIFKLSNRYLQELIKQDPVLSNVRIEKHFEGDKLHIFNGIDIEPSKYKEFSSKFTIEKKDIIMHGIEAYMQHFEKMAEEMKSEQVKHMFKKVEEVTEKTGNVVEGKGEEFDYNFFLLALEKIQINFNENGEPYLPTLFVNPVTAEKLKEKIPEWESSTEYKEKYKSLIEQKRVEWNDRESNRKLVD